MPSSTEESVEIEKKNRYFACMSKRRYHTISNELRKIIDDDTKWENAMTLIGQVMNFDINSKTSDPIRSEKVREARRKKAEEMNTSTYKAFKLNEYHKRTYPQKTHDKYV